MNKKETTKAYIYTLSCPDTGKVMYVGKTFNPDKRYDNHVLSARDKARTPKQIWIHELLSNGKKPVMQIIEICDRKDWVLAELRWIHHFMKENEDLKNVKGNELNKDEKWTIEVVQPPLQQKPLTVCAVFSARKTLDKIREKLKSMRRQDNFQKISEYTRINRSIIMDLHNERCHELPSQVVAAIFKLCINLDIDVNKNEIIEVKFTVSNS